MHPINFDIYKMLKKKQKEIVIDIFLEAMANNNINVRDWDVGRLDITVNELEDFLELPSTEN